MRGWQATWARGCACCLLCFALPRLQYCVPAPWTPPPLPAASHTHTHRPPPAPIMHRPSLGALGGRAWRKLLFHAPHIHMARTMHTSWAWGRAVYNPPCAGPCLLACRTAPSPPAPAPRMRATPGSGSSPCGSCRCVWGGGAGRAPCSSGAGRLSDCTLAVHPNARW